MTKGPLAQHRINITSKVMAKCLDGKLLLIRRDKHHIEFPGGRSEVCDGNDPLKTAVREFEEETGIVLDPSRLVQIHYVYDKGDHHHWYCFEVELTSEDFRTCHQESSEGRVVFYNIADLHKRQTVARLPIRHQIVLNTRNAS